MKIYCSVCKTNGKTLGATVKLISLARTTIWNICSDCKPNLIEILRSSFGKGIEIAHKRVSRKRIETELNPKVNGNEE